MGNAMNLRGTFYFKDHHYESLFLSIDSLSCATDSLDLCILFKFIFLYLILALFTYFAYTFDMYITMRNIFSYPWWCRWLAKARNLILIFNSSSQRSHLNYILLSNVYSFEFPENISVNLHQFTNKDNKASLLFFNRSESLECTQVCFSKVECHPFL